MFCEACIQEPWLTSKLREELFAQICYLGHCSPWKPTLHWVHHILIHKFLVYILPLIIAFKLFPVKTAAQVHYAFISLKRDGRSEWLYMLLMRRKEAWLHERPPWHRYITSLGWSTAPLFSVRFCGGKLMRYSHRCNEITIWKVWWKLCAGTHEVKPVASAKVDLGYKSTRITPNYNCFYLHANVNVVAKHHLRSTGCDLL